VEFGGYICIKLLIIVTLVCKSKTKKNRAVLRKLAYSVNIASSLQRLRKKQISFFRLALTLLKCKVEEVYL